MKKTLSVIALLLSLLVVMSFGALSAYAEEGDADTVEESSAVVSADASEDESVAESNEASDVTSEEDGDTTSDESGAEASEDASTEASTEASEEASDESGEESGEESSDESSTAADSDSDDDDSSSFPWALTIFGAIVVIVAIVCFVSVKLNNKLGVWLKGFFRDYKSEIKKVTWPSKDVTIKSTIVVIVCLVVSGIVIGLLDFGLAKLIELFRDLVSK